jgi:alpha-glucosidase (family GH31 glycosyl hydrolase)
MGRRVADLVGHATMPPRWALGYLQSSRHFDGTDEVRGLARTFRDNGLPCDALMRYSESNFTSAAAGRQ